jgi:cytochrome oxidase Cu insertion factor (SCO1/SenC/PrrC family)
MPGMNSGLDVDDPTVVAAFRTALLHQGLIALLIFAAAGLTWLTVRTWSPAAASTDTDAPWAEPASRKLLRVGFGIIWLFDGILQAQPKMAVGLPSQVIEPTAATSQTWVQHVVNWAGTNWSYHPMQAGAAAVWIQVGIGIWFLAAPRGTLSRLAGLVSIGWALVVWVFGESFGGIFAPGLTWLSGAPGAVLIYAVVGVLLILPERVWRTPRPGRLTLAGLGLFLVGMAVLQAWPSNGFWQGVSHGHPGNLPAMIQSMAQTPQPSFLGRWVTAFGTFDQAHGFAVNLVVVAALAVIGAVFLTARPQLIRPALVAFVVLCLADWVLVEDLGFLGGLGTDPNSMVPFALLATGGYLALTRPAAAAAQPSPAEATEAAKVTEVTVPAATAAASPEGAGIAGRLRPALAKLRQLTAAASIRSVAAIGAIGVVILGTGPMAVAQASPNADPILAQALTGSSAPLDYPAPGFSLTDQYGRTVTLASLRGKVVLLTGLDPVCTSDCPMIGQYFRQAAQLLGADASRVELVAVVLNPNYTSLSVVQAFDRQEGLNKVADWLYLTGTLAQLQSVWHAYGLVAEDVPAGAMVLHNEQAFVIDAAGQVRFEFGTDPGPATSATQSSFAVFLADAAEHALGQS